MALLLALSLGAAAAQELDAPWCTGDGWVPLPEVSLARGMHKCMWPIQEWHAQHIMPAFLPYRCCSWSQGLSTYLTQRSMPRKRCGAACAHIPCGCGCHACRRLQAATACKGTPDICGMCKIPAPMLSPIAAAF